MSYSKDFYLAKEEPYEDENSLRSNLEEDFRRAANQTLVEEFFNGFTPLERRILKRLISTKEPSHKIARRFKLPNDKLMTLLFRATKNQIDLRKVQLAIDPNRKQFRQPYFGCGHPISGNPNDDCVQCVNAEVKEAIKHNRPCPIVLNFHKPEEPDDV